MGSAAPWLTILAGLVVLRGGWRCIFRNEAAGFWRHPAAAVAAFLLLGVMIVPTVMVLPFSQGVGLNVWPVLWSMLVVVAILLMPLSKEQRALAFLSVFPLGIIGWVIDVILVGEFGPRHGTGCRFSRSETPVLFWTAMVLSLCLATAIWALVAFKWE